MTWRRRHRDADKWGPWVVLGVVVVFGYLLAVTMHHWFAVWRAR